MKTLIKNNINGILGTIIFHLIALIIFLLFRIGQLEKKKEVFLIDFAQEQKDIKQVIEEQQPKFEDAGQLPAEMKRNIAVNVENKLKEEISTEKYEEELKQELGIKDLHPNLDRTISEEDLLVNNEKKEEKKPKKNEYSGPTTVTYSLKGRWKMYLPLPIYKCEGGGKVVIEIIVNQQGEVISADFSNSGSETSDPCLVEAAKLAAYQTYFNADINSEQRQKGYISYQFISQY